MQVHTWLATSLLVHSTLKFIFILFQQLAHDIISGQQGDEIQVLAKNFRALVPNVDLCHRRQYRQRTWFNGRFSFVHSPLHSCHFFWRWVYCWTQCDLVWCTVSAILPRTHDGLDLYVSIPQHPFHPVYFWCVCLFLSSFLVCLDVKNG